MQTLFEKHQTPEDRKEVEAYEEWKKSKGTNVIKSALKWSFLMIALYMIIDVLHAVSNDKFWTIKGIIDDNIYRIIGFLFGGVLMAWIANNSFRKKLREERDNKADLDL